MQVSPHWASWLLMKRIRTIMIVNVAVAVLMGILAPMRRAISWNGSLIAELILFLLVVSAVGAIITVPLVLVQIYLYPKKHGLWYAWEKRSHGQVRDVGQLPAHLRYPPSPEMASLRTHWQRTLSRKTTRTRLFEGMAATESVSRAALLLTVAENMDRSGKKEAARTCYRQIIDRFAATPEAQEAERRIEAIVRDDRTD
jgi:hypothetical protein